MNDVIAQIRRAFADDVRPAQAALLHPECHDDMDLERLYEYGHWTEVPDEVIVSEYAALAFLSPDGFRHFIPAYMIWVLRHPDGGEAVVDATIWAFLPELHGPALAPFVASKVATMNGAQRGAVGAFLEAMAEHHADAMRALTTWR